MGRKTVLLGAAGVGLVAIAVTWRPWLEPGADRSYEPRVVSPALRQVRPRVLFDHGHRNVHSLSGRYSPFGRLLAADGCRVRQIDAALTPDLLVDADILVIVNAKGKPPDAATPAFSAAECASVRDWVRGGGALLLVADHHPCGEAARTLAEEFGVGMSGGWTDDSTQARPGAGDTGQIVFTRADGGLAEHAITRGDGPDTRVDTVETFTGQSLQGPPGAAPLLLLGAGAMDRIPVAAQVEQRGSKRVTTFATEDRSAAGRAQGLALEFGRGRVVVLAEAAMLSAQIEGESKFGMNAPGNDNRAFTLNVIRWLAGARVD